MVSVWEVTHHSLDCSVGLSFCAMWYKALIAFMLNKGGFLSAGRDGKQSLFHFRCKNPSDGFSRLPNSIQVIPKDQTSTFPSYWPSSIARMTSGAILEEEGGVWNEEEKTFNSCQNCFFPIFLFLENLKSPAVWHWSLNIHELKITAKHIKRSLANMLWNLIKNLFTSLTNMAFRQRSWLARQWRRSQSRPV